MKLLKLTFLYALLLFCQVANAQLSLGNYAIESVNIVDVEQGEILYNYTIIITDGKISSLLPSSEYVANDTLHAIRMKGKYVIPGLIDTHVHLATNPTEEIRANAEKTLHEMLLSGVTSVRDMAGDTRALSSLSRDALVGDIVSPDIYYSALMAGTVFFSDPRTIASAQGGESGKMPYMREIADDTDLTLAVAEARGTGAKGIKLYANLTESEIDGIGTEAARQGIKVWAHAALPPTKPSAVIGAGVVSVSHSPMLVHEKYPEKKDLPKSWLEQDLSKDNTAFWDKEYKKLGVENLYEEMKQNGVILDATVSVYKHFVAGNQQQHWKYEMCKRITEAAHKAGVTISAGSDTDQATFVQEEMKLLVNECGFAPMEAIKAATVYAAQAIAMEKSEGTLEEGKKANLVILNGNPIENINNIDQVVLVIKSGKLYTGKGA
ncbi:amidohydrolase family protein [Limibacter armeniacum]|uniref:amidohydrolase family protein n=1 Tax=Limibacter armeniacum TaxID=466084 RepID=UPI002FE63649